MLRRGETEETIYRDPEIHAIVSEWNEQTGCEQQQLQSPAVKRMGGKLTPDLILINQLSKD